MTPASDAKQPTSPDRVDEAGWPRRLFAELVGTFVLTFVAAGGVVFAAMSHGKVSPAATAVAPGLVVAALIFAIGDVSGAHFNPAVTLAFAARRVFEWPYVPVYWVAQVGGATLAATVLRALFGTAGHVGRSIPHTEDGRAFVVELVLTAILVFVVVSTATRHSLIGNDTAIAVGATIVLCGLIAGPISGASMNPARSLGSAIVDGSAARLWPFLLGPILGSAVAVGVATALHPHRTEGEVDAAKGDGKQ